MIRAIMLAAAASLAVRSAAAQEAAPPGRAEAVRIIGDLRKIVAPEGIERLEKVRIGGIDQWVSIRGRDRRNPVLLMLHGGPGFVMMPTAWYSAHGWDEYFTVVQWDQRGAGKTYVENDSAAVSATMTLPRMLADTEEMVRWVRSELGQPRMVLVGASWGTILGLHIAQKHPEWLHAYVGIGQGVDVAESERRGWRWAMARAREASHAQAMRELQSLAPYAEDRPPTRDEIELQRRWLLHFGGGVYRRRSGAAEAAAMRLAPEYSDVDVAKVWEANDFSERHLLAAALTTDLSRVRELKVPVVLFSGRSDYVVNAVLAEEWLAKLTAPHKRFVWFEQSGHDVFVEEPGKTLVSLVQYVLPLTGHRAGMPGRGAGRRPR